MPPIVALVLIVLLDQLAPVAFLPAAVSFGLGAPLLLLGFGLWVWGIAGMVRRGESPDPRKPTDRLVTTGPFRISRNPIYTGGCTGLLGLAILLDTAAGVAVAVVLALAASALIRSEEPYLESKFGDEWRDYRSRVRRWI